jgi:CRP/FNR family transcriptional regulator, anaerobic regulatory protein
VRGQNLDGCRRCSLHSVCANPGAPGQDATLHRLGVSRGTLPVGHALFHAGQSPGALFALRSGSVKEVLPRAGGTESVVHVSVAGEVVGIASLAGRPSRTSAFAVTATRYCRIPLAAVATISSESPGVSGELMRMLAEKMGAAQEFMASLIEQDAVSRVAAFVLDMSARLERAGFNGDQFRLGFSRRDIASYLGMTIETVSRAFTELRRRRLLEVRAKDLALLRVGDLRLLADATPT